MAAVNAQVDVDSLTDQLNAWVTDAKAKNQAVNYVVGVDIGATHTRVALQRIGDSSIVFVPKMQVSTISELMGHLKTTAATVNKILGVPSAGSCLDAAGLISQSKKQVEITNWVSDRVLDIDALPAELFPAGKTMLLNDLEACCHGLISLKESGTFENFFAPLWGDKTLPTAHWLVMAMGTGLGVGALLYNKNKFEVLPMETGHTQVVQYGPAHPDFKKDLSLIGFLSNKLYKGIDGVEYEDICSGRGLGWAYEWSVTENNATNVDKTLTPGQVAQKALATPPCPYASEALWMHYKYLIRVAQGTCVGLQTKAVIFAGDNQVSNHKFVRSVADKLQSEFLTHPKSHWLQDLPVWQQEKSTNLNIFGALLQAKQAAGL